MGHPVTESLLSRFSGSEIITINHYKDVFCRANQNYMLQKRSPNLILACQQDYTIYKGAPVCQNFGNEYFYYSSCVMNCIYDCEYCYLQGMYPSANIVIFVNMEDLLERLTALLQKHSVYLCVSYDTDLLALEPLLGFVGKWIAFADKHRNLKVEIRTKCANFRAIEHLCPPDNVILAWTLSPEYIIHSFEHHTPSLSLRLDAIRAAIAKNWKIRLCFDPIIAVKNFQSIYLDFIDHIFTVVSAEKILDISLGVFRISGDYLKNMRKHRPDSAIIQYPYCTENNVCYYGREESLSILNCLKEHVKKYVPDEQIFIWDAPSVDKVNDNKD